MFVTNTTNIRVIYADTDAMGIVYHTNYIKWFEIGRSELLRELRIPYSRIEEMGYRLPLTEVSCSFFFPARYDEIIVLESVVEYVKHASIKFQYTIYDEQKVRTLVQGTSVHACINGQGKVVRFPRDIVLKIDPSRYQL